MGKKSKCLLLSAVLWRILIYSESAFCGSSSSDTPDLAPPPRPALQEPPPPLQSLVTKKTLHAAENILASSTVGAAFGAAISGGNPLGIAIGTTILGLPYLLEGIHDITVAVKMQRQERRVLLQTQLNHPDNLEAPSLDQEEAESLTPYREVRTPELQSEPDSYSPYSLEGIFAQSDNLDFDQGIFGQSGNLDG